MEPIISVVMSVFNDSKYIKYAIESILNQNFTEFEFIIIDDGSSDNSSEIILQYQANDERIVFIKNEVNIGLAKSLNKGLNIAKGIFFARQDADDISAPERLNKQFQFAIANPEYGIIGSDVGLIDIYGNYLYADDQFSRQNGMDAFNILLQGKALFPHGSVLINTSLLKQFKGYNNEFYFSQDRELWLRMCSCNVKVYALPDPLYFFRKKPLRYKGKIDFRSRINTLLNEFYTGTVSEDEFSHLTVELFTNYHKKIEKYENPYYLSDYWYSIGLTSLHGENRFKIYKYLNLSLRGKNSVFRILIRLISYLIPLFPFSFAHRFRGLIKKYKSNT